MVNQEGTEVLTTELEKLQTDRNKMIDERDVKLLQIINIDKKIVGLQDALTYEGDEEELVAKRAEVISLINTVAEKNTEIAINQATIAAHEVNIAAKEVQIAEQETTIATHETTIDTHEATIEANDATIVAQLATISTQESTIASQVSTIATHEATIATNNETIADQDNKIEMLNDIANHDMGYSISEVQRASDPEIPNIIDE